MSETLNIIGEIHAIETIAEGHGIGELTQLRQRYGKKIIFTRQNYLNR